MWLHLLIAIVLILLAVFRQEYAYNTQKIIFKTKRNKYTQQKLFFLACMTVLMLLTALRSNNVGNDTQNYIYFFNDIARNGLSFEGRLEEGYLVLNYLISLITKNEYVFLFIITIIYYIIITKLIVNNSESLYLSLIIFYASMFAFFCSGVRQSIAISLIFIAYVLIKKKLNFRAVLVILLASLMHYTALIFILIIPLKKVRINFSRILFIVVISIALSVSNVMYYLINAMLPQYSYLFIVYAGTGQLAIGYYVFLQVFAIAVIKKSYEYREDKTSMKLELWIALLGLILLIFGFSVNAFDRIASYFTYFNVIFLANAVKCFPKKKSRKILTLLIIIFYLVWFTLVLYLRPEWSHIFPYEFSF